MKPSELLKRCKDALPGLPWSIQGHEGEEMVFGDLGGGRRVTCAHRVYGEDYAQISVNIIDTGRTGPTFAHAGVAADVKMDGCVALLLGMAVKDIKAKLVLEEARLVSLRACVEAIE